MPSECLSEERTAYGLDVPDLVKEAARLRRERDQLREALADCRDMTDSAKVVGKMLREWRAGREYERPVDRAIDVVTAAEHVHNRATLALDATTPEEAPE